MFKFQRLALFVFAAALLAASLPSARRAQQTNQANPPVPAPTQSSAQNPPAQQPTNQDAAVRISTQLVQVDVVVTDKKGKHVEDLTDADFELLVDGKKQSLSHFSHVNLPPVKRELAQAKKKTDKQAAPESMPTRQIAPNEVRRTIAFIVDDLGLGFASTERVRETLRKFVAEQMQEGDLIAIIRTGNGLGMLEQFTSDKRLLYSAVERLIWNPLSRDMSPTFGMTSSDAAESTLSDSEATAQASAQGDADEFYESNFTTGTMGAINFVVRGLRDLPGRKSVILLSDGFKVYSKNDNDNTTELILQQMRNLTEQANRSSVVIYSMDAKGLQGLFPGADTGGRMTASTLTDAAQSAQETQDGPLFLALQTGGFAVTNTNDLNIGIQEAIYDQQSYYLLGFDPEDGTFDRRYHKIKVTVNRPGLRVRTRSGFFGVNDSDTARPEPKTRGEQLLGSILAPFGKHELSLRMTPVFFNSGKEGPFVRALFHVDCSKLAFKDGPKGQKLLNLELAAFAFDEDGATADVTAHRINLSFDEKQYQQVLANGLAYRRDFQLKKPGAYQFRAVLRDDQSGQTGTASQFMRVPDLSKKRLALSGVILTAPKPSAIPASDAANSAANSATGEVSATAADKPANNAQPPDMQTTPYVRNFPRTGWIQYGAAIYNAATDKKTGQPQVTVQAEIYRDGKSVYQFPARAVELPPKAEAKRFDYVGRLRLNNLPEGKYLLHLVVKDELASKKYGRAEEWMDFSVH
jgi:VWFA-related protein